MKLIVKILVYFPKLMAKGIKKLARRRGRHDIRRASDQDLYLEVSLFHVVMEKV